jgi:hypothetical protein
MTANPSIFDVFNYIHDRIDYVTFSCGKFGSATLTIDRYGDVYIGGSKDVLPSVSLGPYTSATFGRIDMDVTNMSAEKQQERIHDFISGLGSDLHVVNLVGTGVATNFSGQTATEAIVANGFAYGGSGGASYQILHNSNPQGNGIFDNGFLGALDRIKSMEFSDELITSNPMVQSIKDMASGLKGIIDYLGFGHHGIGEGSEADSEKAKEIAQNYERTGKLPSQTGVSNAGDIQIEQATGHEVMKTIREYKQGLASEEKELNSLVKAPALSPEQAKEQAVTDFTKGWQYNFRTILGPTNPAFIDATLNEQDIKYNYRFDYNPNGVLWRVNAAGIPHPDDLDQYFEQQRVIESATNRTISEMQAGSDLPVA